MRLVIDIPDKDYEFVRDIFVISCGRMSYKGVQANVINAIKQGTPYNAERPQGEWLKSSKGKTTFFCSECGREIDTKPFTRPDNFPFCHCGAKMQKGGAE